MVNLATVRASNTALVRSQPLVAVFIGGTAGIGASTLRALATAHGKSGGKGLRAYIVGRNGAAAAEAIKECRSVCGPEGGDLRFVKADDLALMKDVDRVCAEIIRLEKEEEEAGGGGARIDILVMSQHYFPLLFEPRQGKGAFLFPLLCFFLLKKTYSPLRARLSSISNVTQNAEYTT